MIKQIKLWIAECDKCKKKYSYGENDFDVFKTKKELIEVVTENSVTTDWQFTKGKALCEDCQ